MKSKTPAYFESMYRKNIDPWNFETSPYESAKYADTIEALRGKRYRSVLEVGCSIGVLTKKLAEHAESLTAIDVSSTALDRARRRCAVDSTVRFELSRLPERAPDGIFDLVVLSEVCYYWDPKDLELAKHSLLKSSDSAAEFLIVHWTPFVESYPQTGDAVHEAFLDDERFTHLHGHRSESYRLDLFVLR